MQLKWYSAAAASALVSFDAIATPSSQQPAISTPGVDLSLADALKPSIRMFQELRAPPSCMNVATAALQLDCAALNAIQVGNYGDDALALRAKQYAVRITICDLVSDKISLPPSCQVFMPTVDNTQKKVLQGLFEEDGPTAPVETYPAYEQITHDNLYQCIDGLSASAQTWTTYDNHRKDAVATCQAVRSDLNLAREEQLAFLEKVLRSVAAMGDGLGMMSDQVEHLKQQVMRIVVASEQATTDIYQDSVLKSEAVQRLWSDLEQRMQHGVDEASSKFTDLGAKGTQALETVDQYFASVQQKVELTNTVITDLFLQQGASMKEATDYANTLQARILYIMEVELQKLSNSIGAQLQDLDYANAIATNISVKLEGVDHNVDMVGTKIVELGGKAEDAVAKVENMTEVLSALAEYFNIENLPERARNAALIFACALSLGVMSFGVWRFVFAVPEAIVGAIGTVIALLTYFTFVQGPMDIGQYLIDHCTGPFAVVVAVALALWVRPHAARYIRKAFYYARFRRSQQGTYDAVEAGKYAGKITNEDHGDHEDTSGLRENDPRSQFAKMYLGQNSHFYPSQPTTRFGQH